MPHVLAAERGRAIGRFRLEPGCGTWMSSETELYREKAAEMRRQAHRADTPYLRAMYHSIADAWDQKTEEADDDDNGGTEPPREIRSH